MGMFDYLRCEYDLPVEGLGDRMFQTKDTPAQWMDTYRIDANGQLWGQEYDIEDQSDPNAEGIDAIIGCMTRVNVRETECSDYTGEIVFYTHKGESGEMDWSILRLF